MAPRDERRMFVDQAVVQAARLVVPGVGRLKELS
jgi:hypothetical protein